MYPEESEMGRCVIINVAKALKRNNYHFLIILSFVWK